MTHKPDPKKPFSNIFSIDAGLALVIGAAVFQAYQFGRALYIYDPSGWAIKEVNIGGLFLGAVVNVIVVLAATRLPALTAAALKSNGKNKSKAGLALARKEQKAGVQARFAQVAFYFLMALSPALIAPALFIAWRELPLWPALIAALSIGWALAPDLAIALGGFVAGKSLVQLGVAPATHSARTGSDGPTKSVAGASQSAKSATHSTDSGGPGRTYPRRCEHCASDSPNGMIKSPNAVGGHMKKWHPELCKPKVLVNQLFKAEVEVQE